MKKDLFSTFIGLGLCLFFSLLCHGQSQTEKTQNRFYLVNDVMSTTFRPLREALFQYHFNGLDNMHKDLKKSKEEIEKNKKLLDELQKLNDKINKEELFEKMEKFHVDLS